MQNRKTFQTVQFLVKNLFSRPRYRHFLPPKTAVLVGKWKLQKPQSLKNSPEAQDSIFFQKNSDSNDPKHQKSHFSWKILKVGGGPPKSRFEKNFPKFFFDFSRFFATRIPKLPENIKNGRSIRRRFCRCIHVDTLHESLPLSQRWPKRDQIPEQWLIQKFNPNYKL